MRNNEPRGAYSDTESITSERAAFSGPLSVNGGYVSNKNGSKKSTRFNLPPEITMAKFALPSSSSSSVAADDEFVQITLDIRDDSVAVHSVHGAAGCVNEDPELALLAKRTMENKSASLRSSLFTTTSDRIKQVPQELKRVVSRRASNGRFDRTKSVAAHALKGLKFITARTGAQGRS